MKYCSYLTCDKIAEKEALVNQTWRPLCFRCSKSVFFFFNKKRTYLYLIKGGKYGEDIIGPFGNEKSWKKSPEDKGPYDVS